MKNQIIALLMAFSIPPLSLADVGPVAGGALVDRFLSSSAFTDGSETCPHAPTLYRGIHSDSISMLHVVRNMLGDSLAEFRSWGMSKSLGEKPETQELTESQWLRRKIEELERLKAQTDQSSPICADLAVKSAVNTNVRESKEKKLQLGAYGIAASPSYTVARRYAHLGDSSKPDAPKAQSMVIRIEERVPRAASLLSALGLNEYYIPIVIPADDITGAWSTELHLAKVKKDRQDVQIDIYAVPGGEVPWLPEVERGRFRLLGRIVRCASSGSCRSDQPKKGASKELLEIIAGIGGKYPYRFVNAPGTR